jgi:hypothetical protein
MNVRCLLKRHRSTIGVSVADLPAELLTELDIAALPAELPTELDIAETAGHHRRR